MIRIYTDGSCRANTAGAWGYIIVDDNDTIIHSEFGQKWHTTNQQMELTAVLKACKYTEFLYEGFVPKIIYSDSAYIINCYKDKWYDKWLMNNWMNSKNEPVKNKFLWEEIIPFFTKADFDFVKVKGHDTNEFNNYVDERVQKMTEMMGK